MIFDVLKAVSPSELDLLDDSTAAYLSFEWLVDDDAYLVCPDDEKLIQRYVLGKLYFQTMGDQWIECSRPSSSTKPNPTCNTPTVSSGKPALDGSPWLDPSHECDWAFINCNDDLCVTRIEVDENCVSGTLVNEVDYLPFLEVFTMDGAPNKISGTIPTQFGNLTQLEILDLDENGLTGTIPEEIYSNLALSQLDFDNNSLTGTISTLIGNLKNLTFFQTFSNPISGTIPTELATLSSLVSVGLYDMDLTGTVPPALCDNVIPFGNIQYLWTDCGSIGDQLPQVSCDCCDFCFSL